MSEFDKEAEREKLREKFAKDEEKRQSTKRMSELLLKGATMTNSHCNRCGDPVFRFDGQEFCPSCQDATVAGGQIQLRNPEGRQQEQGPESAQAAEPAQTTQATQATQATGTGQSEHAQSAESPTTEAATADATTTEAATADATATEATTADATTTEPAAGGTDDAARNTEADVEPTQPPVPATESESAEPPTTQPNTGTADLDAARASLRRTVTRYAEEAEQTDDPRRARELLAAAHEAAETLAALRR
ncbi:Sjogren's syndrome/scleroderma autoantigen 1 (Autoantigen p27) [Halogranum gelatinilyticum]|uniref:Sjogren's syndrome/scleroderma autoantigen 1 (Autoantigen p27) n=1 Tax=Halogranum gelatinilyticum TaxID=660521 RepID=A0A1G9NUL4_9EURY|nr:Sjogren's syndrome/scleroderma autoantigen 1 family protein [Halogranum gelatinilyticum]SDL90080.1 Sjogren's syndrome/scleroderma autoantigen 1 (Autoantigen p27) [Halogranum gelatinilyticum]